MSKEGIGSMGVFNTLLPKLLELFKKHLSKGPSGQRVDLGGPWAHQQFGESPKFLTHEPKGLASRIAQGGKPFETPSLGSFPSKIPSLSSVGLGSLLDALIPLLGIGGGVAVSEIGASPKEHAKSEEAAEGKYGSIYPNPPLHPNPEELLKLLTQAAESPGGVRGAIQAFRLFKPDFMKGGPNYQTDEALLSNLIAKAMPGKDIGQLLAEATGGSFIQGGVKKKARKGKRMSSPGEIQGLTPGGKIPKERPISEQEYQEENIPEEFRY